MWLLVLVLVALLLFLFGPSLLGLAGDDGGAASPTPSATVAITPTPVPTEPPAPTPQVYVVAKGDTMSKIAKKFGLTIEEILAANPQIKNPNKIGIDDEITIPVPTDENGFAPDDGTVVGESTAP
jgi:LysM repeat protein